jgi:4-amino-4-deoxy-L-arabinose transferase-like glycosyltransferase
MPAQGEFARRIAAALRSPRAATSLLLLLAAAALGAASLLVAQRGVAPAFRSGDALEHALMARRLAQGEGFTTPLIYPAELRLGAGPAHPAVKFPPLWPLALAGPFAVFGAQAEVAHGAVLALFAALVAACAALASARGGRGAGAGAVAALAVATSPATLLLAFDPVSETLFAFTVALALLAAVAGAHAGWVGVACGLAYLTRYNGALLLPAALALVFARRRSPGALLACGAGFLAVAAPWWLRNLWVAGDPFYSLLNLNLWISAEPTPHGGSLFFQPEPDLASRAAADPMAKLSAQLPFLLAHLPFASANLAACAGVLLGCLRRDLPCLAFTALAGATLVVAALALPLGRYLAPLFPAMLALGAAAWLRYGGRLRLPALALLLMAPALPGVPAELPDLALLRGTREQARGADPGGPSAEALAALRGCLSGRPLVLAQSAPRLAWDADAVAIYAPDAPPVFWRIVEEQPVDFAQVESLGRLAPGRFASEFAERPDCGPGIFERRSRR